MKNEGEKAKRGKGEKGKPQNRPAISARTVKAALRGLGGATASAVEDHLRVQIFKERVRVLQILQDLVKGYQVKADRVQGELTYYLCDKPGARGAVQARLWRFACHRLTTARPFTAAEAAGLAKCNLDYTEGYCRWLWEVCYLAIAARGRAGALLYQVVGGKEHDPAPHWNRRAEKRKKQQEDHRGEVKKLPIEPCTLLGIRNRCAHFPDCMRSNPDLPPPEEHRPEACATNTIMRTALESAGVTGSREQLDAALEDFGRTLVKIAGGVGRAWEIIRDMKGELLALEEQGHGEPTEGHH